MFKPRTLATMLSTLAATGPLALGDPPGSALPVAGVAEGVSPTEEVAPMHAQLSLICDAASVKPGESFTLGLHFQIEEAWHLYWNGLNDSGLPPTWELVLPEGFTAGDAMWPAPARYVGEGSIVDHIYVDSTTILIPIKAPQRLSEGQDIRIDARAKWLACREACVREGGSASLTLTGGAGSPRVPQAGLIQSARARVPAPAEGRVQVEWTPDSVKLRAPGATRLTFFPGSLCSKLTNLEVDGVASGESLSLRVDRESESPRVEGVLEVTRGDRVEWLNVKSEKDQKSARKP